MIQKHRSRGLEGTGLRQSCVSISLQRLQTMLAKWDNPLFPAFAAHQNHSLSKIDVFPIESRELAHSNPTCVKELKNSAVPQTQRSRKIRRLNKFDAIFHAEVIRDLRSEEH